MADDKMRESWMRRTGGKWPCTNYEAGWNDALAEQPAQGDPELDGLMESDFTTALEAQAWRSGFKAGNMKQPAQGGAVVLTNDQIERHSLSAGECPPNSQVILVSSIRRLAARNAAPPAPSVSVPMAPPVVFAEWLRSNMPPDTIISDPDWWAMAIWSAARRAINAAPVAPSVPDEMWAGPPHNVDYVNGWNACRDAMLASGGKASVPESLIAELEAEANSWWQVKKPTVAARSAATGALTILDKLRKRLAAAPEPPRCAPHPLHHMTPEEK